MANPTPTEQDETLEPKVHALTVLICQDCVDLKGETCNNPQCVFCRRTMVEVRHYLDVMLLCPIVDGKRLILVGDAVTNEDTRRAAVAGPPGDAETLVKKWIATLQDESRVTDEDAEDLTFRIIAFAAATSSPAPADAGDVGPSDDYVRGWQEALSAVRTFGIDVVYDPENHAAERAFIPTANTGLNCVYNRHSRCVKAYCDCTCHVAERTRVEGEQCKHRYVGRGEYGDASVGYMCADCGIDLDDTPDIGIPASSDSARRAAEGVAKEIVSYLAGKYIEPDAALMEVAPIADIIQRCAAAPADNDAESLRAKLPSPAQQALQIVTAWRAVVGGDDLLIHYIKQAIEENRATTTKGDR